MFQEVDREAGVKAFVHLWNKEYPEFPNSEEEIMTGYRHLPEGATELHYVAYDAGEPIGAVLIDSEEIDAPVTSLSGDFLVDPNRIEDVLAEAIGILKSALRDRGLVEVGVWGGDRLTARRDGLSAAGFEVAQTVPCSRLDLDQFDPSPFQAKVDEARTKFRLASAAELDEEGMDWIPLLWETTAEIAEDIPRTTPYTRPELEDYRNLIRTETVVYQLDTMMVALDGDRIVGYSRVTLSDAMPGLAQTGMSGTARSHRRQGIVTALKVLGIERMKAKGIRILQTDNDESNPMYQINLRLGFKPCWKWELWKLKRPANGS